MNAAAAAVPCPQCGTALPADAPEGLCPRCLIGLNLGGPPHDLAGASNEAAPPRPPAPPAAPPAEIARHFPHLEILECLGRGGMGVVYKARQPRLDRLVALKVLAPGRERDPQFAERFTREAQALARLSHPAIVAIHDFGEAQGLFYLLMEYVEGRTLRSLLREGRMAPENALALVPRLCDALQFAHEQGVVHRDIKPENILVDPQGRVKIADFGIAKLLAVSGSVEPLTEARGIVGTPHYMAPEQVEHPTTVDHRADIYSLGVVFYELLTGELPLGKFAPPSQKSPVDPRLDPVVLRSLEKEPGRRYQHAGDLKTDVESLRTAPPASAASPAPPSPVPAPSAPGLGAPSTPPNRPAPLPDLRPLRFLAAGISVLAAFNLFVLGLAFLLGIVLVALDRRNVDLDGLFAFLAEALQESDPAGLKTVVLLGVAFLAAGNLLCLVGASHLRRMVSYRWALAASALILVLPPGLLLGMPLGLWALVVLGRRSTQAVFHERWLASYTHGPRTTLGTLRVFLAAVLGPVLAMIVAQGWMEARPRGDSSSAKALREVIEREQAVQEMARSATVARSSPSPSASRVVPPVVIGTLPASGDTDVDPTLREIRVRFSKPMLDSGWSWAIWTPESFPTRTGEPRFLEDHRTCVLPVRLQPGRTYSLWINSDQHRNFQDTEGTAAVPYLLTFKTRSPAPP